MNQELTSLILKCQQHMHMQFYQIYYFEFYIFLWSVQEYKISRVIVGIAELQCGIGFILCHMGNSYWSVLKVLSVIVIVTVSVIVLNSTNQYWSKLIHFQRDNIPWINNMLATNLIINSFCTCKYCPTLVIIQM